jgi:hypothetical protein
MRTVDEILAYASRLSAEERRKLVDTLEDGLVGEMRRRRLTAGSRARAAGTLTSPT